MQANAGISYSNSRQS